MRLLSISVLLLSACANLRSGPVPPRAGLFSSVALPAGPGRLEPFLVAGGETLGVDYVEILRR